MGEREGAHARGRIGKVGEQVSSIKAMLRICKIQNLFCLVSECFRKALLVFWLAYTMLYTPTNR